MTLTAEQTRWINQTLQACRWLLPVLLVLWLSYVTVNTLLLLFAGPQLEPRGDPQWPQARLTEQSSKASLTRAGIESWGLFGEYQAAAETIVQPEEAPETRLRLELVGLFRHQNQEKARAVIAQQGQDAQLYKPGDRVPGNAILEDVYADRVMLRRQGQLETLRLRDPELEGVVSEPRRSNGAARGQAAPEGPVDLESLAHDPAAQRRAIIDQLGLTPVEQGAPSGYRISDNAPREMIGSVGLRSGDVLLSVNGYALGNEQNDVAALSEVMGTGKATIEVQRGSRRFTVNYPP